MSDGRRYSPFVELDGLSDGNHGHQITDVNFPS